MDQTSEPNSGKANMLVLSDWEFETMRIKMLSTLIGKMDNNEEQMSNLNGEIRTF